MAIDYRIAALGLVALGALLAGVATMSDKPQPAPGAVRASPAGAAQSGRAAQPVQGSPAMAAHPAAPDKPVVAAPPGAQAGATAKDPVAPPTEGKVGAGGAPESKFTHFRVGNRNVKRILIDGERVWVGTSGGVIRYSPSSDEYRLYDTRSGLRANGVAYVGKLTGRIAVGTYGGGLSLFDSAGDRWETFGVADGLGDEFVSDALAASNGDLWIATGSGVNRVRGGAMRERARWDLHTVAATKQGLPNDRTYGLAEGRNGDIWLATEGGVARFQNGEWNHWNHDNNPNFTVSVTVDRAGIVWAGTLGAGLARYDGGKWKYYTEADGLPGNHVFALHQDAKSRLWVGTDKGLARLQNGKFKVMTVQDGLLTNAVFAMASIPEGIWAGGHGGVARIRGLD